MQFLMIENTSLAFASFAHMYLNFEYLCPLFVIQNNKGSFEKSHTSVEVRAQDWSEG